MASLTFERDCEPAKIIYERGAMTARLECTACGSHEDWKIPSRVPPERIRKYFIGAGWLMKRRASCPKCNEKKGNTVTKTEVGKPVKPLPLLPSEAKATEAAKAARREAHDRIAVYFDIPNGSYTDGYSDQRIAEETGVAVAWVKQRREEEFGVIKMPKEISDLYVRANEIEIALMDVKNKYQSALDDFKAELLKFEKMFSEECSALKKASDGFDEINRKIDQLAKRDWQ